MITFVFLIKKRENYDEKGYHWRASRGNKGELGK
jgi:hypothetical protein